MYKCNSTERANRPIAHSPLQEWVVAVFLSSTALAPCWDQVLYQMLSFYFYHFSFHLWFYKFNDLFWYWYVRYTNKCKKYSIDLNNKRNKQIPCNNALGTRSFNVWHIVSSCLCAFVSLSLSSNVVKVCSLYDQSNKISQHAYSLYNRW